MIKHKKDKQFSRITEATYIESNDMISYKDSLNYQSTSKFYHQNQKQIKRFHTAENPLQEQDQQKQQQKVNKLGKNSISCDRKQLINKKPKSTNSFVQNQMFFPHQKIHSSQKYNKHQYAQQKLLSLHTSLNQSKIKDEAASHEINNQISYLKKLNEQKKLKIMQIYRPKQNSKQKKSKNLNSSDKNNQINRIQKHQTQFNQNKPKQINNRYQKIEDQNEKEFKEKDTIINKKSKSDTKYAPSMFFNDNIVVKMKNHSFKKINYYNSTSESQKPTHKIPHLIQVSTPVIFQPKASTNKQKIKEKTINQQKNITKSLLKPLLPKYTQFYDSFIQKDLQSSHKNKTQSNLGILTDLFNDQTMKLIAEKRYSPSISIVKRTIITPSIIKQTQNQKMYSYQIDESQFKRNILSPGYRPKLKELVNLANQQNFQFLKTENGTYYGQLSSDNQPHGVGIIFYKNGKLFQGQFQKGLRTGQGYQLYKDGSFYIGSFRSNLKNGKGRFQWNCNQIYDGQWVDNQRHGSGQWISQTISYVGEWKNNIIEGFGVLTEGKQRYQGQFINYNKQGHGTYRYQNGELYTGKFKNNRLNGAGQYFWPNGDYYKGDFFNNKRHGNGFIRLYNEKITYQGQFRNDKKCGLGQQFYNEQLHYLGNFQNDFKHGWGCLKRNQALVYQGYWINNKVIQVSQTPNAQSSIIIQEENEQLNNQVSAHNIHTNQKSMSININRDISNMYSYKKKISFPKPKDPDMIKGRSRYMRMNNHYIKKSIVENSQKGQVLSKQKSQKKPIRSQQNYQIY